MPIKKDLTSVNPSISCCINQLEPAKIALPKACLRKTDSDDKLELSTSLSNELHDSNSPDTKAETNQVSKNSSPRFCNTVQASASPSVDVIDTTKKKKSRKNSIRKKSSVFARTVHDCNIERKINVITEKSEKEDNVKVSDSTTSHKMKQNSRDVKINEE